MKWLRASLQTIGAFALPFLVVTTTSTASVPQACAPSGASETPSFKVQVVDPNWFPLPNVHVTVKALQEKGQPLSGETDENGYSKFPVATEGEHVIEAKLAEFKTKRLKVYWFKNSGEMAYVQLQLQLSGPFTTVY